MPIWLYIYIAQSYIYLYVLYITFACKMKKINSCNHYTSHKAQGFGIALGK